MSEAATMEQNDDDVVDAEFDEGVQETTTAPAAPAIELFALVKERVHFANLNIRAEKHGDEREAACDIKLSLKTANSVLKKLKPGLLETFYTRDRQGDVEDEFLRKLKFPQMGPVSWDFELPRATLRIHDIDSDQNDVVLAGGKANKFKLTFMEGGTVQIDIRCQFSKPDEDQIPKLMRVLDQDVHVSLCTEALEEKPDNFQQVDLLSVAEGPRSAAYMEAQSMFSTPGTDLELTPDAVVGAPDDPVGDSEPAPASNVEPIRRPRAKRTAAGAE